MAIPGRARTFPGYLACAFALGQFPNPSSHKFQLSDSMETAHPNRSNGILVSTASRSCLTLFPFFRRLHGVIQV